jgi:aminotransferase in exopolysaccharide biosynthesis
MHSELISFVRNIYQTNDFIPLHAPSFKGNEKKYVNETLESTFVSSVGSYVNTFEKQVEDYTGTAKAVTTVNGSAALHTALFMSGVKAGDLVITQALTFVATCNAIYHMGAEPILIDISNTSLGLCPNATKEYLERFASLNTDGECIHKQTNQRIKAIVPMHTFGHPVELDELLAICLQWNITLVEDAAESLGSFYKGQHTGTMAAFSALSFNGNKIITTGGGGIVLCKNLDEGLRTRHLTSTAKVPHPYEYYHDEPGFNYRLPNLNAALGCAQMEVLPTFIEQKRMLAKHYQTFFEASDYQFISEPHYAQSNYWLNSVICPDTKTRDLLLKETNKQGVMTRPVWQLMHRLPMFSNALRGDLPISELIESHLINLPSTPTVPGKPNE